MHRHFFILIFLGLTASAAVLPLTNGGFEDALAGWTVTATDPDVARVTSAAASLGKAGLRVRNTADCREYEIASAGVPVKPGRSYTATFWSGGGGDNPGGDVGVCMVFKNQRGEVLKPAMAAIRKWPGIRVSGGTFFDQSVLAAAAPEGAVELSIHIRSGKGPTGPIDIDDFIVEELDDAGPPPAVASGGAHPIPSFDPARLAALLADIKADPYRGREPPRIVLKLDDFTPSRGGVHAKWRKVADWAQARNIKINFGIIANGLEEDAPAFFDWVKQENASVMIEFWFHGYDHAKWKERGKSLEEFHATSYELQKKHFEDSQKLAREKLGFAFESFGAPFNATDGTTARVLSEDPYIKVWMYGNPKTPAGKTVLERCPMVNIEMPTFIPNFASFVEGYAHNRGGRYFVLQGHPTHWDDERWEQFTKIVGFLIGQKADFVLARDFAAGAAPRTRMRGP